MNTLKQLQDRIYKNAINKGFYENGKAINMGERIALIHSECSEALEADRNGKYCVVPVDMISDHESDPMFIKSYKDHIKGTFEEEMADIVIRVMDMCAFKGINLEDQILAKMRYNEHREKMHGKKY